MKRMQRVFGDLDSLRYVDGRLDDERRAAFVNHLADDPAEAERVALWNRQNDVLRSAFASVLHETVPVSLRPGPAISTPTARAVSSPVATLRRPAMVHALPPIVPLPSHAATLHREKGSASTPGHTARTWWMPAFRMPLAALAPMLAAALVLLIVHDLLPATESSQAISMQSATVALVKSAADAYQTYATDPTHPVEFTAAQIGSFDRWVQQRLGATIVPADFKADGWTLLGARLVPGSTAPAAFFIYENQAGDRMGLLATRSITSSADRAMALGPDGDSGAAMTWEADHTAYVITVGKSLDWLSRHAEVLRDKVQRAADLAG